MKKRLAVVALLPALAAAAERPKPGEPAPPFSLPGSNGKTVSLSEFGRKKTVVLAFYPKAFTGG